MIPKTLIALMLLPAFALAVPAGTGDGTDDEPVVVEANDLNKFDPPAVVITPGTTVVWRNVGIQLHTATLVTGTTSDAFDLPIGGYGECFDGEGNVVFCEVSHTFEQSGIVVYYCVPHYDPRSGAMWGAVAVQ